MSFSINKCIKLIKKEKKKKKKRKENSNNEDVYSDGFHVVRQPFISFKKSKFKASSAKKWYPFSDQNG